MIESNKKSNYQNELDRLSGEIQRDNLPHNTLEHLNDRIKLLKSFVFV